MATPDQAQLFFESLMQLIRGYVSIDPPSSFGTQVAASKTILKEDYTGIVGTIVDFVADAIAEVNWKIETGNKELDEKLAKWFLAINEQKRKDVPSGWKAFVREVVYEHYTSGLIVTKIGFQNYKGLDLPMTMYLADSEHITVEGDSAKLKYEYKLCDKPLTGDYYVRRDGRWYDKYPTPYMIRKGIYTNYQLKKTLKQETQKIFKEALWYLFQGQFPGGDKVAVETDYSDKAKNLKKVVKDADEASTGVEPKTPAFFGKVGTDFKHLIPNFDNLLDTKVYAQLDRDLLGGMGLIEIIQGIGSTRKESILNPKPLIQKTAAILLCIENLLIDMLKDIAERNKVHKKYFSDTTKIRIVRTSVKAFWTQDFKEFVRSFYDRGLLSYRTTLDSIDFDVETERERISRETNNGDEITFYPKVTVNMEKDVTFWEELKQDVFNIENEENLPEDKKTIEKENYKASTMAKCPKCNHVFDYTKESESHMGAVECPKCKTEMTQKEIIKSKLETAPYKTVQALPPQIRKALSAPVAKVFIKVFNKVYDYYIKDYDSDLTEQIARRTAWKTVKQVARKNKKGLWVLKKKMNRAKQLIIDLTENKDSEVENNENN